MFSTHQHHLISGSVYDDIHPILAVLNNIITRGLPTKASPYIEEVFKKHLIIHNVSNNMELFHTLYKKL